MLSIAGQTAGPIRLRNGLRTLGWPWNVIGYKKFENFLTFFFNGQHLAPQLVLYEII